MQRRNVPLMIALSIPFVMVGVVALSVAIPRLFFHPKTSLLFVTDPTYWSGNVSYTVQNGTLMKNEIHVSTPAYQAAYGNQSARLWVYDPVADASREVSFESAQALRLDPGTRSPDGYEIRQADMADGVALMFFMHANDFGALMLQGKGASRRIKSLPSGPFNYGQYARFLGWIVGGS